MTTLQDIMGLITKRKIKTPSDNDYIISAAYTDTQGMLKPQPKMEANLLSIGALKKYIQNNTVSNLQKVTEAGAITTLPITANSFIKQGGASSQILAANGEVITAGTNITISGGTISSTGGGGSITLSAIGSTPNANAATITGDVLNLQPASASFGGVITTGSQTIAGAKTFSSQTILGDGIVGTPIYGLLPQATVGSTTGGVLDIRNTNTNIVAGNTVGTLQFSAKDDNSIAYANAQIRTLVTTDAGAGASGSTDMVFLTNNSGGGISPTEKMRLNNLGLLLTNETASTIASFDSNKSIKSLTTADGYPSLDQLKYVNGVTSSIQTQFSGKQATLSSTVNIKSINGNSILGSGNLTITAATQNQYTILANNTASSAVPTEQGFRNEPSKAYAGATPTWTGTVAPSGTTNHTYSWNRIGNLVTLRVSLDYATTGTSLTAVTFDLPSDCPIPELPSGVSTALSVISYGVGTMAVNKASTATMGAAALRLKTTAPNTFDIQIQRASGNCATAYATIQYFTTI